MKLRENIKNKALPIIALTGITLGGIVMFSHKDIGKKIVKEAKKYVGEIEIQPNKGWTNKYFESLMKRAGWKSSQAYCILFIKMILLNVLKGKQRLAVAKLFSASSQTTWANLLKNQPTGLFKLSKTPKVGSIAIYKHMKKKWAGHGDIVINFNKNNFTVVSANERKGVEIKTRNYTFNSNTFRLLGFVNF